MSSDTHPDASEIPTLPPPDRAWHVPDGATSVFDDPAPAPSLPTLPTLPPAAPAVPMAAVAPAPNPVLLTPGYGYGDVPGGMAAVHRASLQNRTRRRPLLHRIVRSVVVLALIAGIVGAGYIFVQGFRDARALPAFDTERPAYGTVVLTYEETAETGAISTGTVTASGDPSVFEIRSDPGAAEPIHMTSDGTTIIDQTDAEWSTYAVTPESVRAIESLTRLPMFEDYVPDVIRPFVSVADKSDVVVEGVGMERIELHIDHDDFAAADPVAAATWEVFIGLENDERTSRTRLVITVDELGIAWVVESWSDISPDRSVYRVVSYADAVFAPVMPTAGVPTDPAPVVPVSDGLDGAPATTTVGCWDPLWCGGPGIATLPPPPPPPVSVAGPSIPTGTLVPPAGG
jgi:hypothetical protein